MLRIRDVAGSNLSHETSYFDWCFSWFFSDPLGECRDEKLILSHYTLYRRFGERRYSSHSFSTSALDGGEWSASRPGRPLAPGKGPPVPTVQETGWTPEPVWTECRDSTSKLDYNHFLLNQSQFVIHLSLFHSTLYSLRYRTNVIK
jgi:hypothetical protein